MTALAQPEVVSYYDAAFAAGSDKSYPTLNLVRIAQRFFGPPPAKLLEYAFGTGANLLYLLERGYEVSAIDTSSAARRLVESKLAKRPDLAVRAHLELLDPAAERLPYADESFDYVSCLSVLSLLSSRGRVERLLAELRRVLKPGGRIVADINGPDGMFSVGATELGEDVYEYRGRGGKAAPMPCYCPRTAEEFAAIMRGAFAIDDVGFAAHRFLGYVEQEFIVCAHKA